MNALLPLRTRVVITVLGLAALTATASCGSTKQSDPTGADFVHESAAQILMAGAHSMASVRSAHVTASVTMGGSTYAYDLSIDRTGTCAGTISLGSNSADVIVKDKVAYMRAGARSATAMLTQFFAGEFNKANIGKMLAEVGSRWMAGPTNAEIDSTCNLGQLLGPMAEVSRALEAQPDAAGFTKGQIKVFHGVEAVDVEAGDSSQQLAFWIATERPHYLVKLSLTGAQHGSTEFSAFGVPVVPQIPTGADVVELATIRQQLQTGH